MPMHPEDLTGGKFTMLTAIRCVGRTARRSALWETICDCGALRTVSAQYLKAGDVRQCGAHDLRHRTHGDTGSKEHQAWTNMKHRCSNQNWPQFYLYGGRGIKVCERWNDYANFLEDVGRAPSPELSIERKNGDGDYEPGNVRWATARDQQWSRRDRKVVSILGQQMGFAEAVSKVGIVTKEVARSRVRAGWSVEDALLTPKMTKGRQPAQHA